MASFELVPPSGYSEVTLTSYSGNLDFSTEPVAGDVAWVPDAATLTVAGELSGADGDYVIYLFRQGSTCERLTHTLATVPESAEDTFTLALPAGHSSVRLESGYEYDYIPAQFYDSPYDQEDALVDWLLVWDSSTGATFNSLLQLTIEDETTVGDVSYWLVNPANSEWTGATVTGADQVPEMDATDPPAGTVTIGTITKDHDSASIPFTYDDTDQTGFEHSTDGGSNWSSVTSPISLTGLDPEAGYSGEVRAVNAIGASASATYSFTTDAAPLEPPAGTVTLGSPAKDTDSISLPFTYDAADQTGFEYRVDGGAWSATTSPVTLTGLSDDTEYLIEVSAVNNDGRGTIASTTVTTDKIYDYAITVVSRSTIDTTPLIYGHLGDAVNPTVTVNEVEYTPSVSNGQWSVTANELSEGAYTVTLDAEEVGGNPLQAVGEITIIIYSEPQGGRRVGYRQSVGESIRPSIGSSIH